MNYKNRVIEVFDKHAAQYESKYMDLSIYHAVLDKFCSLLPVKQSKILDMACGPGNITNYLLKQNPELIIFGTDISPQMLAIARANNPAAHFKILDCRDLKTLKDYYHGLLCGFGLPYLTKEEAITFIKNAYSKLLPGGLLYISTMEDDYNKSEWKYSSTGEGPPLFIHYHEAAYLSAAAQEVGFNIKQIERPNVETKEKLKEELVFIFQKA